LDDIPDSATNGSDKKNNQQRRPTLHDRALRSSQMNEKKPPQNSTSIMNDDRCSFPHDKRSDLPERLQECTERSHAADPENAKRE
jgi:hypothetical protein